LLALGDVCTGIASLAVAAMVSPEGVTAALWSALALPLWILLAKMRGLYDADHVRVKHKTVDEAPALIEWATLCVACTAILGTVLPNAALGAAGTIAMWIAACIGAVAWRTLARAIWRFAVPPERGLIIGSGPLADAVVRKLDLEGGHHLALSGSVPVPACTEPSGDGDAAIRQRLTVSLDALLHQHRPDRVILATQDLDEATLSTVTATCRSAAVKLSVAPPLRAMLGTAVELNHLAELPLIEFRTWDPSRSTMLLKRLFDVCGSALALLVAAPVLLAIAVVIKLDSRGPALFRQERAGLDGKPFSMLKFRTMTVDAQQQLGQLVALDALEEPMFKLRDDPRITRAGRAIRRWSLDELPQLVNVLRGDMSLVGPRPEEAWLVERYAEPERFRLQMRPGLTGPMQVHGRGELRFQERLAIEREYVENYSFRKDLRILAQTGPAVIRGRGAF
jgi:exopolysaccharide biosynthesis polyprenyl glycosylphosphotransferase